ncbi:hypothetical protein EVJ50_07055 [Synechococcus sp. RSCCF101]|uniref:hypothetical protein n=1 Tax=Synechococcus sp. RSCCF101 TaxID=2511069 RepID=UPI001248A7FF|nr:hypothetical protein [Synechococcus sp. RSCCF101]QEY32032.1 hypothetical protein EVJ50_07055 [Synechococcus sp. RSCCF101]
MKNIKADIEGLAGLTADATKRFLRQWNELAPLHETFIERLATTYATQLLGDTPSREIWAAQPGLGKTTTLRFFLLETIKGWRTGEIPKDRGIMVCSNQVTELEDHVLFLQDQLGEAVVPEIGLYHTKTEVKGFQPRVERVSYDALSQYPIVFCTQSLLRRKGTSLHHRRSNAESQISDLCFYGGQVRLLCWDEEAIATSATHLSLSMLRIFRERHGQLPLESLDVLVDRVLDPFLAKVKAASLDSSKPSTMVSVPELEAYPSGRDRHDVEKVLSSEKCKKKYGDDVVKHAKVLAQWSGQSGLIRFLTNNATDSSEELVMKHVVEVPDALDRAVVTDASALTSRLIQLDPSLQPSPFIREYGKQLKRYDNLTLYVMRRAAGKSRFLEGDEISPEWRGLAKEVIPKIRDHSPAGDCLVVTFRGSGKDSDGCRNTRHIHQALESSGISTEGIHYTTYGKHKATNEYRDCTSVVLLGTYHYDERVVSSLARAQTRTPEKQVADYTTREILNSQTAADIQQALSRGMCRSVMKAADIIQAKPMVGFVALSSREQHGVLELLEEAFPGIRILDYETLRPISLVDTMSTTELTARCLADHLHSLPPATSRKRASVRVEVERLTERSVTPKIWRDAEKRVVSKKMARDWKIKGHSWTNC